MPSSYSLDILRTTEELNRIADDWSALWRKDPYATPFQSREWLLPWWHQFGQPELRTVSIRQGAELLGLLPLYIYREPKNGQRQLLPLGVGTTDYLGGIFAQDCSIEAIQSALDLALDEGGWDTFNLTQLRSGDRLLEAVRPYEYTGGCVAPSESCSRLSAVRRSELPSKIRRNLTNDYNRASREGSLAFHVAEAADALPTFEVLCRLHSERWHASGLPGVLADDRVVAWHREAIPELQKCGLLRMCSLTFNGEPVAVIYSLLEPEPRSPRTQYLYLSAFSTQYGDISPGSILLAEVVEHAAQQGVNSIDLLRGDERYKRLWHAEPEPTWGLSMTSLAWDKNRNLKMAV